MKKILLIVTALLMSAYFAHAEMNLVKISITDVVTNTAAGTVTDYTDSSGSQIEGLIENIWIDFSGAASPDIDIDITTVADKGTGAAKTIYSVDDLAADENVAVRQASKNTGGTAITNDGGKIALYANQIRVRAYDANKASINLDVYILISIP